MFPGDFKRADCDPTKSSPCHKVKHGGRTLQSLQPFLFISDPSILPAISLQTSISFEVTNKKPPRLPKASSKIHLQPSHLQNAPPSQRCVARNPGPSRAGGSGRRTRAAVREAGKRQESSWSWVMLSCFGLFDMFSFCLSWLMFLFLSMFCLNGGFLLV